MHVYAVWWFGKGGGGARQHVGRRTDDEVGTEKQACDELAMNGA